MNRFLLLIALLLVLPLAACTAPNDFGGPIDTDLWEIDHRPDTEVPNQYPNGRALGDYHEVIEGDDADDGH